MNIQSNQAFKCEKVEKKEDRILSDVVASRCLTYQPTRTANCIPYEGFRNSYKVVDYGNPKLSFYGILIMIHKSKTEVLEALEFDNLKDFYVVGEDPNKTSFSFNHFLGDDRMLLKRKNMTDEPFSFKS